jgi:hypothetical protein
LSFGERVGGAGCAARTWRFINGDGSLPLDNFRAAARTRGAERANSDYHETLAAKKNAPTLATTGNELGGIFKLMHRRRVLLVIVDLLIAIT